jgi:hypothetical protein
MVLSLGKRKLRFRANRMSICIIENRRIYVFAVEFDNIRNTKYNPYVRAYKCVFITQKITNALPRTGWLTFASVWMHEIR